jgi:DNA-binding transcriptional LysR family regulator
VRLFERNRRKTALTAAGVAFREYAAEVLLGLDHAVHKAKLAANGKLGILRIGFISTAGNEIVPTIIRQFRELNAEVEFSLRNILTTDQIQMLEVSSASLIWHQNFQLASQGVNPTFHDVICVTSLENANENK